MCWFTTKTEWADRDAPWEREISNAAIQRKRWTEHDKAVLKMPDDRIRCPFKIESEGRHIGWVSSYLTAENDEWILAK